MPNGKGSSLRLLAVVIWVLAFGLTATPGRSADMLAERRNPEPVINGSVTADSARPSRDDLSYLFTPFMLANRPVLKQSVFIFGGRTDSGNLNQTFAFGLTSTSSSRFYDNYIVGGAYQRDFLQFNSGFLIGAEVGLADRFGHYKVCCDTPVYSNNMDHSAEVWAGATLRYPVLLFDALRVSPGFVFGLSAISSPIGQEGEHQIVRNGSAKLLFYLGFETAFALRDTPDTELVIRIHHRSGAYGTLGGLKEGNNANVIGLRQRF
jgi:hypothetical protein